MWLLVPLFALLGLPASSQIVTDGAMGPRVTIGGPEATIGADLGTQRGANLFHSFESFGLRTGESATFTGPDTAPTS